MKNVEYISFIILLFAINNVHSTSYCEQDIFLLTKPTGATDSFWIGESVSGECNYDQIIQIFVHQDSINKSIVSLKKNSDWQQIRELLKSIESEKSNLLENNADVFFIKYPGKNIIEPKHNALLLKEFNEYEAVGKNVLDWNKSNKKPGIVFPKFNGINSTLIYFYPKGLYINYNISKVHFFPKSQYLLFIIDQPRKAVGFDTMHGFMIFKIN
jgi:hypothetical protein